MLILPKRNCEKKNCFKVKRTIPTTTSFESFGNVYLDSFVIFCCSYNLNVRFSNYLISIFSRTFELKNRFHILSYLLIVVAC
jgi:hypothetical protein